MMTEADVTLAPGRLLFGKYLLLHKLGEGGMGEVWLVRHHDLDVERALKTIVASVAFNSEARARFRREAWVMARFSHPNAVAVHDAVIRPGGNAAYIEMEYVRGQSLNKVLKPGVPMPLELVARIVEQLCAVLQVAHEQGIVHRDLKPSNLMLLDGQPPGQEHLKVLDFGIAKILGDQREQETLVTRTGMSVGTPQYMSPEQIVANPGEVDARSDIYSVGLILYEMLTGHRPFGSTLHKLIYDHLETPPPSFAIKKPDLRVPPGVERLVLRCLEKDPARRPQSARELAEAFRKAAGLPDPSAVAPPPRTRRTVAAVLALALALVLTLIPVALWLRPPSIALPPHCVVASGATLKRVGDRVYANRIERASPDGPVPFLLITPKPLTDEPRPFYIMETKVWNGLFAKFARENPDAVKDSDVWRPIAEGKLPKGWNARLPAMDMTAGQAHLCAKWLGGKLPSVEQWNKAAGLHDRGDRIGPFEGPWNPRDKMAIAVNREDEGPLPVGSAWQDKSPFGCLDMAGNGLEWTRTPMTSAFQFPPPPGLIEPIYTRGQRFSAKEPLRFDVLEDPNHVEAGQYGTTDPEIGFRVIIELDVR
jgi:hypothetical protein